MRLMSQKIKNLGRWFLVGSVLLLLFALGYQQYADRRDARLYPPRGELYGINGMQLHLVCEGSPSAKTPTVVLESGRLSHSAIWEIVMVEIGQSAHICAYDRPGIGWSEPSWGDLSSDELTSQLNDLLVTANVFPPFVLVGHSMGGVLVRDYAQLYPEDVAGMVLVDSSIENQRLYYPEEHLSDRDLRLLSLSRPLFDIFGRLGGFRMYHTVRQISVGKTLTEDELRWQSRRKQSHFGRALVNEVLLSEGVLSQQASAESLGDIPLVVLEKTFTIPKGASAADIAHEREWKDQQQALVRLSTNSHWIESLDSGHDIPIDDPDLVVTAIQTVLEGTSQR